MMNLNWTRIWFSGWWFVFFWLIINSIDKWGDNVLWVWFWFVLNTIGIWVLIYRPKIEGKRRENKFSQLQIILLTAHILLLIITYLTAALGNYISSDGEQFYSSFYFFRNSLAWLLPLQLVFVVIILADRNKAKSIPLNHILDSMDFKNDQRQKEKLKSNCKQYIKQGETDKAIIEIEKTINSQAFKITEEMQDNFIILQNEWANLKRDANLNIQTSEQISTKTSSFHYRLLRYVNDL